MTAVAPAFPRSSRAATLIGCLAILLWSALALLTAASGAAPPFELAALTFAIGGAFGLVYAAARGRLGALVQPWPVWLVGVGGLFGYHALYFAALRRAPPGDASLIAYLWPLLIVLFSALLPGESLRWRHILGAALGMAGAVALFIGKTGGAMFADAAGGALVGYGLALCCAFVWSAYSLLSRRLKAAPTETVAGFAWRRPLSPRFAISPSRRLSRRPAPASGSRSSGSASVRSDWPFTSGTSASRTATSAYSASPPMRRRCYRRSSWWRPALRRRRRRSRSLAR